MYGRTAVRPSRRLNIRSYLIHDPKIIVLRVSDRLQGVELAIALKPKTPKQRAVGHGIRWNHHRTKVLAALLFGVCRDWLSTWIERNLRVYWRSGNRMDQVSLVR